MSYHLADILRRAKTPVPPATPAGRKSIPVEEFEHLGTPSPSVPRSLEGELERHAGQAFFGRSVRNPPNRVGRPQLAPALSDEQYTRWLEVARRPDTPVLCGWTAIWEGCCDLGVARLRDGFYRESVWRRLVQRSVCRGGNLKFWWKSMGRPPHVYTTLAHIAAWGVAGGHRRLRDGLMGRQDKPQDHAGRPPAADRRATYQSTSAQQPPRPAAPPPPTQLQ